MSSTNTRKKTTKEIPLQTLPVINDELVIQDVLPRINVMRNRDAAPAKRPPLKKPAPSHVVTGSDRIRYNEPIDPPPWAIPEYELAYRLESLVRQAIRKKIGLVFKEGYHFVGNIDGVSKYVQQRLAEIEWLIGTPISKLLTKILVDLLVYANAFLIKARNDELSSGSRWMNNRGFIMKPIYGLYYVPPHKMLPVFDKYGHIVKWEEKRENTSNKSWSIYEVAHFTIDEGTTHGFSMLETVFDDINLLREVEEESSLITREFSSPILHVKIGEEGGDLSNRTIRTSDGETMTEVEYYNQVFQRVKPGDVVVTSARVNIDVPDTRKGIQDTTPIYEKRFTRVVAGLGMSPIDFGVLDGASKSGGEVASEATLESARDLQRTLSEQFNFHIVRDLLCENNDYIELVRTNILQNIGGIKFNDPDINVRIKREAHFTDVYTKNSMGLNESRILSGNTEIDEKRGEEDFYYSRVGKPTAIITASGGIAETTEEVRNFTEGQQKLANQAKPESNVKKKPGEKTNNSASNRAQPQNQHSKDSNRKNGSIKEAYITIIDELRKHDNDSIRYNIDEVTDITKKYISAVAAVIISQAVDVNIRRDISSPITIWAEDYIDSFIDDFRSHIKSGKPISEFTESNVYRLDFMEWALESRSKSYARLKRAQIDRSTVSVVHSENACEECKARSITDAYAEDVGFRMLPPHHPECKCELKLTKNE